ncbi:Uma2 family endonuclease [Spirulina subsalsa FACHB-351]|uniref:Uma2 family endonuclease n=1 Tax=Spirulina subsalsa FACHB-351 TaxID=234711 RepID=A0ABT3L348_9CYAN|nr:Uma2 family endonuclease [Spirulina subsalsa FACHB-351]
MYDLPSEEVGEPGLPDQFHPLQAELLRLTFRPGNYDPEQVFSAMDLNVYYDENQTRRYKRPDWFGVAGIPRLYENRELRLSYVVWQEGVSPSVVVELLSPSTQAQDLGQVEDEPDGTPTKWAVYEQILRIPYYVVYDRTLEHFRAFHLESSGYVEVEVIDDRLWLEELQLGLGLWQGSYENVNRLWLRFYEGSGDWIPTPAERAERERQAREAAEQREEQERQAREAAEQRAERFRRLLLENGINPHEV